MFRVIKKGEEADFVDFKLEDVKVAAEKIGCTDGDGIDYEKVYLVTELGEAKALELLLDDRWFWFDAALSDSKYVVFIPSVTGFLTYRTPVVCPKDSEELFKFFMNIDDEVEGF